MDTTSVQNIWQKSKLLVKAAIIGIIILVLQIPIYYVTELVKEREARQKEAIAEVGSKWAVRQYVIGTVLVVTYWEAVMANGQVQNKI